MKNKKNIGELYYELMKNKTDEEIEKAIGCVVKEYMIEPNTIGIVSKMNVLKRIVRERHFDSYIYDEMRKEAYTNIF
jgi:hypothetical protein